MYNNNYNRYNFGNFNPNNDIHPLPLNFNANYNNNNNFNNYNNNVNYNKIKININNKNNNNSSQSEPKSNNNFPDLYSRIPINFEQGIPMDLLEPNNNNLKDYITCGICFDILLKPICCRKCKKKYCKNCISRNRINNQNKCPYCRQKFEILEIDHTTKDILNDIKLKCFFVNEGCKEILIYDNFIKHINLCEKGEYKCNTKNCHFTGNLDDMIAHLDKCGLSLIQCEYCLNDFQKINFDEHFNKCKNEIIPCYYCNKRMEKFKLKEHEDFDCPKYKIECKKCKEKICRENMNAHKNNKLECYENRINYLENYKEKSEKLILNLIERIDKLEKELNKEKESKDNSNGKNDLIKYANEFDNNIETNLKQLSTKNLKKIENNNNNFNINKYKYKF